MKVIVATKSLQGQRSNDFSFTEEGELVKFSMECDREEIDGKCGCRRSFGGFKTSKATTTAKIIDSGMTKDDFIDLMKEALTRQGWYGGEISLSDYEVKEEAEELLRIANAFEVGDVIEKRGEDINRRGLSLKDVTDERLEEFIFNYHEAIDNECADEGQKKAYRSCLAEQERRGVASGR